MLVDRAKALRALNLTSVSGIDAIVISKDGFVCQPSADRTVIVYGNTGLSQLDEDWVLPDMPLFGRMLRSFTSPELDIARTRNSFVMTGDSVLWRYRLGNKETIQTLERDVVADLVKSLKMSIDVDIDTLKRIAGIQSIIKAAYIHFVSKDGKFSVLVGEEDTYSGAVSFNSSPKTDFDVKIPAERFTEIVDKVDESKVRIEFGIEGRKVIRVCLPEFSWLIGAVKTEEV